MCVSRAGVWVSSVGVWVSRVGGAGPPLHPFAGSLRRTALPLRWTAQKFICFCSFSLSALRGILAAVHGRSSPKERI